MNLFRKRAQRCFVKLALIGDVRVDRCGFGFHTKDKFSVSLNMSILERIKI